MNSPLFLPLFSMVALTLLVSFYTWVTRIRDVIGKKMSPKYFLTYDQGTPTKNVTLTGRHYINLFEMPVLFYAGIILAISQNLSESSLVIMAWVYVFLRLAHTVVHLSINHLTSRMMLFILSYACLVGFWFKLLFIHLSAV